MSKLASLAAVLPFAHLLGVRADAPKDTTDEATDVKSKKAKAAKDEDGEEQEDKDSPSKEKDNDGTKGKKAKAADEDKNPIGDDDDKDDATKGKKAKTEKSEETEDDDDVEEPKGKKAKAAKAEDDEADEGDANAARRAEKSRCASIVAAGVKLGSMGSIIHACSLAFDTDMTADAATQTLHAMAAHAGPGASNENPGVTKLTQRMAALKVDAVGADEDEPLAADNPKAIAQRIMAAAAKARPNLAT